MESKTIKCNKYRNGYRSRDDGFTLIEVLIAIAIFAIGMLAIASMQLGATHGTTTARSSTEFSAFAEDQMERLTRLPYDHDDLDEVGSPHSDDRNDPRFSASWVIEDEVVFEDTKTVALTIQEYPWGKKGDQDDVRRELVLNFIIPEVIRGDE